MRCCPFCGHSVTEENVHKSSTGWKEYTDTKGTVHRHYVNAREVGATSCWKIVCPTCGANLSADSRQELLEKWSNPVRSEWADQEHYHDNTGVPYLQRCPLCELDIMSCTDDSFHPTAKSWLLVDGKKVYFHIRSEKYLQGTRCYIATCPTSAGGCGLSVEADSKQETADKWNTRVS